VFENRLFSVCVSISFSIFSFFIPLFPFCFILSFYPSLPLFLYVKIKKRERERVCLFVCVFLPFPLQEEEGERVYICVGGCVVSCS